MNVSQAGESKRFQAASHLAEIKVIHSSNPLLEKNMTTSRSKEPLMKRLIRWIVPDQRVANRHAVPPVVAYLGHVRTSKVYTIANISIAGFYMVTEDRWIPGTGFPVTLERTDEGALEQKLTVYSTAVRVGEDGMGFTFLKPADEEQHPGENAGTTRVDLTQLAQFLKGLPLTAPSPESLERAS